MNSKFRRLLPSIAACCALPLSALAAPLTTDINYQGRLDRNGGPANGVFDLKFELYLDAAGGTPVVPAIERLSQTVSGGLVAVDLPFGGATLFDGRAFWILMSARPAGSGAYKEAPPRTAVRPTPYSIYSMHAATVKDGSITANSLAAGSVTSAKLAASAIGVPQLNVTGTPGSGQVLSYNGTGLSWTTPSSGGSSPWLLNGTNAYYNGGNVGIGTNAPASKFTLVTPSGYGFEHTNGDVRLRSYVRSGTTSADGGWFGTFSDHALHFEVNGGPQVMTISKTRNVGIGTTDPANKLTVQTTGSGYGIEHTNGTVRIGTYLGNAGWFGTMTNHPLHFLVNNGGLPSMSVATNGNVGIGTSTPSQKLEVDGHIKATSIILRADPLAPTNAAISCGDAGVTRFVPFNTLTGKPLDIVVTDASVRALTIRGGADLAEPFAMSHLGVEPGTVVVIDAANPGKLKASTRAYDKKVAGIVSGANGIQPGISMIQEDKLEAGENVALSGRVYVKADTSAGSIEPGDLLTTSSNAGRAMKAADHDQAQGAIIGKAMTPLEDGEGMVLVLVTLQ